MEKNVLLKVISDDGYVVTAVRPCIGYKLPVGQHIEFDLGKLSSRSDIFCEKVSRPAKTRGNESD
jgi:hypothetical protein